MSPAMQTAAVQFLVHALGYEHGEGGRGRQGWAGRLADLGDLGLEHERHVHGTGRGVGKETARRGRQLAQPLQEERRGDVERQVPHQCEPVEAVPERC